MMFLGRSMSNTASKLKKKNFRYDEGFKLKDVYGV